ncbi:MAG: ABC transporter substrate-binding protein [Candidatus Rokubacteria bacterium]|nr:ABC transporter substrate-binding protein [Candidatus Rokubacteria bacterium]
MAEPVAALSHFGIHVTDLDRMVDFYTRGLGLVVNDRGALPNGPELAFLSRDPDQHHQLVLVTGRPAGNGFNVVNQISFKLPTLADLKAMHARLRSEGVEQFRVVTHGNAWSVYFADPEGNRVELFVDTPWHTPQPYAEPFDIEAPVETILARTEAICRSRPGFASRSAWRQAVSEKMGMARLSLALLACALLTGTVAEAAKDKVLFALNFVPYGIHTPFFVAVEKGFYDQANLDVTVQRGAGSSDTVVKVGAGSADAGFADASSVVVGRAKGAKVTMVAMVIDKGISTIYTYRGSGITKPKDLEGKTVADNAGSAVLTIFPALAAIHDIDMAKIKFVLVAPAAKNPTLIEKKTDAMLTFSTFEPNLKALAAAKGMEIVALPFSDWGLDLYGLALFTSEKMLQERRDVVRRWTDATMRAVAWSVEHPEEAVAIFLKKNPAVSLDLAREQWRIVVDHLLTPVAMERGIGLMTEEKMRRTRDTLAKHQKLDADIPLNELYTNEFLPKLFPKRPAR